MSDTALPVIIRFDTTANRNAFTPTPGVAEQLYIWVDSDDQPNSYYWDGAAWAQLAGNATGITELTGDVTAGPGVGSQAATVAALDLDAITYSGDLPVLYQENQLNKNLILNGNFRLAQRQVVTTLTTYSELAARLYTADRWAITNENASVQFQGIIAPATSPETGIQSGFYGTYTKITNAGKICISQCIENGDCVAIRGRTVRVQVYLKASTATDVRIALLQLQAGGTVDVIPGFAAAAPSGTFISAFNVDGTDPTFGTNLAKITPVTADNTTIANDGLDCAVTTTFQRFGGTFTLPADFKNLVLVIFSDNDMAAADSISIGQVSLTGDDQFKIWVDPPISSQLLECQRFYVKSFGLLVAPAQSAGLSSAVRGHVSVAGATANQPIGYRWPVLLRTGAPVVTFYNPSAANAFARNTSVGADSTATATANMNGVGMDIMFTGVAGWLAGAAMAVHFAAEAEF